MAASVRFFCSAEEELKVLRYLTKEADTAVLQMPPRPAAQLEPFSASPLPPPPHPLVLYIHHPASIPLAYYTAEPMPANDMAAFLAWRRLGLGDGQRMLNLASSPLLVYRRGATLGKQTAPNVLTVPTDNSQNIDSSYRQWAKRSLAWIRRRGTIVHDYRHPWRSLANPLSILNTVYAFPEAHQKLLADSNRVAITLPQPGGQNG